MHALFVVMRDANRQAPLTWRIYCSQCDEEAVLAAGWLLPLPFKIFPSPFEAIEAQNLVSMVLVLMYHGVSDFTREFISTDMRAYSVFASRRISSLPKDPSKYRGTSQSHIAMRAASFFEVTFRRAKTL